MDSQTFLLQLVLILFFARVFGDIAVRLQAPAVIGELLAGVVIGPSLFNLVQPSEPIHLLAQIGIILLLFEVGIETDVGRLASAGGKAFLVAMIGVSAPFILGFLLSYYGFGFSLLASLFVASTLTATSIGITLRVLADLKQQSSPEAQIILGAAVIDDIIGIILLSLLFEFTNSGTVEWMNASKVLIFIVLFFILAPIFAKVASYIIKEWGIKHENPGLIPTLIVSLILFFAWLAHGLGAPELLGGFAAGLALSRQFFLPFGAFLQESQRFSHRVESQMKPIVHLFTPIFFVAIGLSLNLKVIDWNSLSLWVMTGSLLLAAVIGKLVSGFALLKEGHFIKMAVGISMIPRGEVGLIFADVGQQSQVFDATVYAVMILVIAVTTLFAPFALRYWYKDKTQAKEASNNKLPTS